MLLILKSLVGKILGNKYILIAVIIGITYLYISHLQDKIDSIKKDLELESNLNTELNLKILNINKKIEDINSLNNIYNNNLEKVQKQFKDIDTKVSRLDVIKKKPSLVAKMIEKSYKKSNDEIACYTGNNEACDDIKKLNN
jgi:predicted Holliday junction resolvase-like endonuclease